MNVDIIKNLETLGYTNYESRVFYALFTGNNMTTTEIAKAAGIPRSSAYEILKNFTSQGICNEIETSSVVRYQLIDPKVIADKIENELRKSFKTKITNLQQSFETLEPMYHNKEEKGDKLDVELIRGFNRHRDMKFLSLIQATEKEMLLMNRLEGRISEEINEVGKNLSRKGGSVKSIYEASLNFKIKIKNEWKDVTTEGLIKLCRGFEQQGEQVRLSENIFQNMAIFDRKVVFVSLVDYSTPLYKRSDIIVHNVNYAESMAEYFASVWNKSFTIEDFEKHIGTKN
jgi:sugar-specific transcriptional regulator TrmB